MLTEEEKSIYELTLTGQVICLQVVCNFSVMFRSYLFVMLCLFVMLTEEKCIYQRILTRWPSSLRVRVRARARARARVRVRAPVRRANPKTIKLKPLNLIHPEVGPAQ